MKKKTDCKLNSPMYKFLTFLLISWNFIISSVLLLLIIIIVFLSVKIQLKEMIEAWEEIAIFQLTLLGILVTSYVFLLNVVRKRESYDYARKNTRIVIQLIKFRVVIMSIASIITAVSMYFVKIENTFAPVLFFVSIFIMFIKLLLIISIIAHQKIFFLMALKNLRNNHKKRLKNFEGPKPPMIKIFQRITELEQMVKQVYESHAYELADHFSPQEALEFIAEQKKNLKPKIQNLINDYVTLLECRNNAIIINKSNERDVSEIISSQLVEDRIISTEKLFLKHFFSNEYFNNLVFTKKSFNKANFSFTMFEGCIFNSVSLEGAVCQNTNFSGSRFIVDKDKKIFDGSTNLENAKFDGVQFSELVYTPDTRVKIKSTTFRKANFYYSKLKNLEFELAVFDGASFFNSEVIEINFFQTSLNEVNFTEAFIEESNYEYAFLSNAIFYRAKLKNCNFCGTTLKFVEFNEAIMEHINLTNAVCDDASFFRAILKDIDFTNASLNNTVFTESELQDTDLSYAIFKNSIIVNIRITSETDGWNKFEKTEFNHTRFICKKTKHTKHEPIIQRSHFKNAFFSDAYLMDYIISDSWFEHSTFLRTRFSDVTFENTPFKDVVFNNVRLLSVEYRSTQKEKIRMKGVKFQKCEFDQVKFSNIQMKNVTFLECEFLTPEQIFLGVKLNNVKFIGCSFPPNKSYRDFFKGTNVKNMNKSERKKYVEILTYQKNDLVDENEGSEQANNETT